MFRGQGRPKNTAGGAGNAFDFEKITDFVKKIDFPHPPSYMYEPRGCVYEGRFLGRLRPRAKRGAIYTWEKMG